MTHSDHDYNAQDGSPSGSDESSELPNLVSSDEESDQQEDVDDGRYERMRENLKAGPVARKHRSRRTRTAREDLDTVPELMESEVDSSPERLTDMYDGSGVGSTKTRRIVRARRRAEEAYRVAQATIESLRSEKDRKRRNSKKTHGHKSPRRQHKVQRSRNERHNAEGDSPVKQGRRPLDGEDSEDESTEASSESDQEEPRLPRSKKNDSRKSKAKESFSTQKRKPMSRALPPPAFNGRDFDAFKTKFESAAEHNQYDEQELKTHLTYALTGEALSVVSAAGLGKEPWGYDEMIKCLDVRYGRNKARCDIWHLIQNKVRGKRQSVHHYADELKSIIASSKMMPHVATQLAFVSFINGLSTTPDVHAHVLRKDREGTLSNVVAIAAKYERDHGMKNRIDGCTPAWASVEHREVVRNKETAIANANEVMQLLQRDLIQSREAREKREALEAARANARPSTSQTHMEKQAVEIRDLEIKRLRLEQETILQKLENIVPSKPQNNNPQSDRPRNNNNNRNQAFGQGRSQNRGRGRGANRGNYNNNRGRNQFHRGGHDEYRSTSQPRQAAPPPPTTAPADPVAVVNTQQQA